MAIGRVYDRFKASQHVIKVHILTECSFNVSSQPKNRNDIPYDYGMKIARNMFEEVSLDMQENGFRPLSFMKTTDNWGVIQNATKIDQEKRIGFYPD